MKKVAQDDINKRFAKSNSIPVAVKYMDKAEELAVVRVLKSRALSRYSSIKNQESENSKFEASFAKAIRTKYVTTTSSGTAALITALRALELGEGDEVIVPAYGWVSVVSAILTLGAKPVICGIDLSLTIDADDIKDKLTPRTVGIIAIHMRGVPCDMDNLKMLSDSSNLWLLEDTSQAIGGSFRSKPLGSIGDIGTFSFQSYKVISCGEGGAVITNSEGLFAKAFLYHDTDNFRSISSLNDRGMSIEDESQLASIVGMNFRLSELHASILNVQFSRLEQILEELRSNKMYILEKISHTIIEFGCQMRTIHDVEGDTCTTVVFFTDCADRASHVSSFLRNNGINAFRLDSPNRRDMHIFSNWQMLEARNGLKVDTSKHCNLAEDLKYGLEGSQRLLRSSVHFEVDPFWDEASLEYVVDKVKLAISSRY